VLERQEAHGAPSGGSTPAPGVDAPIFRGTIELV
jgi:hypothetical protein